MAVVPDNLDLLKYAELQHLAKQCGVKANMKVCEPGSQSTRHTVNSSPVSLKRAGTPGHLDRLTER